MNHNERLGGWPRLSLLACAPLLLCSVSKAQTFTVLHTFNGPDGAGPLAGVTLDAAGRIYGTTYSGGANNQGVVYRLSATEGG